MLFQARDADWKSSYLVKTFTGETGILDNFGGQVYLNDDNVFIAAPMEDTSTGKISGSVYITDKPPTITSIPDLCSTQQAQITLTSKPSGGTWSGPGIIDPMLGIFDPLTAGIGKHEITYTLPGCVLNSKIDIAFYAKPTATLDAGNDHAVCTEQYYVSVPLSVEEVADSDYRWYYRKNEAESFSLLNETNAAMVASQRGDYRVRVYNAACETFSDIISVHDESQDLQLDPLYEVCGTPAGGRELSASPPGGTWTGPGISSGNKFSIASIPDGNVTLRYRYDSPLGCHYEKEMVVKVGRLVPPAIDKTGNLCETGVVTLSLRGPEAPDAIYSWTLKLDNENTYTVAGTGSALETSLRGLYVLSMMSKGCEASSSVIAINDMFSISMKPESERSKVCYGENFQFVLPSNPNGQYEWYFSPDGKGYNLMTESSGYLVPERSGYYYAVETRGVCSTTSPKKYVYLHPKDSVFIPNVITPNGDTMNETFSIYLFGRDDGQPVADGASYEVFNRWGGHIFSAPSNEPWTGSNAETGIYFWQGKYYTCGGTPVVLKGWLHLIK